MLRVLHIDGESVREVDVDTLDDGLPESGYLWLDFEAPTEQEAKALHHRTLDLDPLAIEDLLEDEHLPKLDVFDDEILLTVHAMALDNAAQELDTDELDLIISARFLVTHHERPILSVRHVRERLDKRAGRRGVHRPVLLMHRILDTMNDVFVSFVGHMDRRLDVIEQDVLSDPTETTRREIYALQRDVIQVRRAVVPQAEVLRRLGRTPSEIITEEDQALFRDIHDHLYRIAELSDSYRQLLDSAMDSYQSRADSDLNKMLKTLTLINAILLPIAVLAGIYGMNFANMPELRQENGYFVLLAAFALITGTQVVLFRRAGWLGNRAERNAQARRAAMPSVLEIPLVGQVLRVPVRSALAARRGLTGLLGRLSGQQDGAPGAPGDAPDAAHDVASTKKSPENA
ncbi:MAG: magnesium transporter [Glaciecola sp.]